MKISSSKAQNPPQNLTLPRKCKNSTNGAESGGFRSINIYYGVYAYDILGAYGGRFTPRHWSSHSYDIYDDDHVLDVVKDACHLAGVHPPEYHPLTREVELVEGTLEAS